MTSRAGDPFEIAAIGPPDKLTGSLTRSGGIIAQLAATQPDVIVEVTPVDASSVPATDRTSSRPPAAHGSDTLPAVPARPVLTLLLGDVVRLRRAHPCGSTPGSSTGWAPTSGCAARAADATSCWSGRPWSAASWSSSQRGDAGPDRGRRHGMPPGPPDSEPAPGDRRPGARPSPPIDRARPSRARRRPRRRPRRLPQRARSCASGCRRPRPRSAATWSCSG